MGSEAELIVASSIPPAPVRVSSGNNAVDAAHWAAYYASENETPYSHPEFATTSIATVEMPPYVASPPAAGFRWIPLAALTREIKKGSLKGVPDEALFRDIAQIVWARTTSNRWQARSGVFAWAALAGALIFAALALVTPVPIFVAAAPAGLGAYAISGLWGRPFAPLPKIAALASIGISAALAGYTLLKLARVVT